MNKNGHVVLTAEGKSIRFNLYFADAPVTCEAFIKALPFSKVLYLPVIQSLYGLQDYFD